MDIQKCMTPRLLAVARFVKKGSRVADVGTDHAYIPVWLVKNGICPSALAMDIHAGPVARAETNIQKFQLEKFIKTRRSDGLSGLLPGEADTVIIAGMGGILINEILKKASHLYPFINHYILQPMTAIEETRKFLEDSGFFILDERLAKEENKIYNVISAVRGKMRISAPVYYYIGEKLLQNRDPLLGPYLDGKIYELDKAIRSMEHAQGAEVLQKCGQFQYLRNEMQKIREAVSLWSN